MTASRDRVRKKITVHGRVQGVCYRLYTRDRARQLGVAGHVKNLPDGTVEVVAEGVPEAVQQLLTWCRKGPPAAKVTSVDVDDLPTRGASGDFRIAF